jgi:hypothetical protein
MWTLIASNVFHALATLVVINYWRKQHGISAQQLRNNEEHLRLARARYWNDYTRPKRAKEESAASTPEKP